MKLFFCLLVVSLAAQGLQLLLQNAHCLSFDYSPLSKDRAQFLMAPIGDVLMQADSIDLTAATSKTNYSSQNLAGRIFNLEPLQLWNKSTSRFASFNCFFSFHLQQYNGSQYSSDGLAFLLVRPDASALPLESSGAWLGLFDRSNNGSSSNQLLAIEFDTFKNVEFMDPNENHIGIDLNNIISNSTANNLGFALYNTTTYVWVDYSSPLSTLLIYATDISNSKPFSPLLTYPVDLSKFLPEQVLIGFSAATGNSSQHHTLLSWSFNSTEHNLKGRGAGKMNLIVAATIVPLVIVAIILVAIYVRQGKRGAKLLRRARRSNLLPSSWRASNIDHRVSGAPRNYNYKTLSVATKNFSHTQLLGKGGFGLVYKGVLHDEVDGTTEEIAVKCISQDTEQGEKEFLAEISIISRIRHRNLVQLKGWCQEKKQLMLVYEFMPNRSLDHHLYPKNGEPALHCTSRFQIMCGVGYALQYLHEECEKVIIHRDVKPSNVMLDSNFNAKLGDFGLARQLGEDASSYATMAAGTRGYMAPECVTSQRATMKSDVYSFGAMLVEVACGRRPIDQSVPDEFGWQVVDWVWSLYASNKIHEAIDPRLSSSCDFGEEEGELMKKIMIVGLACSHPIPNSRPTIGEALGALLGHIPLFTIPSTKPSGPFYRALSISTTNSYEHFLPLNSNEHSLPFNSNEHTDEHFLPFDSNEHTNEPYLPFNSNEHTMPFNSIGSLSDDQDTILGVNFVKNF